MSQLFYLMLPGAPGRVPDQPSPPDRKRAIQVEDSQVASSSDDMLSMAPSLLPVAQVLSFLQLLVLLASCALFSWLCCRFCFRAAAPPPQEAPPATRDGLDSDGGSESDASSVYDQDDEDADVLEMLKHLPNIFVLDALSERYW